MPKRTPDPLDPIMVINAYVQGIFPMADYVGRIRWYAPDPRAILEHDHLHVSRSLRATIRKCIYEVHMDKAKVYERSLREALRLPCSWK